MNSNQSVLQGINAVVTGGTKGVGRGVAHELTRCPDVLRHTAEVHVVADLAREYGFTDIDGTTPRALTLGDV